MMIDTHCHFDMMPNPEAYISQKEKAGDIVIGMTNLPSHFRIGWPHVRSCKRVRLSLGIHPLLAEDGKKEIDLFKKMIDQTSYVGEIGLDFSKEGISSKDAQITVLGEVLTTLKSRKKIVSVHSKRAEKELLELLCEYDIKNVIFHWYSGAVDLIPFILDRGYYFSINEAMCLSENGKAIIERIPRDRILTETDAPYNKRCDIKRVLSYVSISEDVVLSNFRHLVNGIR